MHTYRVFDSLISATRSLRRPARLAITVAIAALLPAITGCGPSSGSGSKAKPLSVTATTTQMGDLAHQIGGYAVTVTTLLQPNIDPHSYQPTTNDINTLQKSAILFRAGGDLDSWLDPALKNVSKRPQVVDLSKSVILMRRHDGRANNSHWHMDASNLALAATTVRDALIKANPGASETYRSNAAKYISRAKEIHAALKICVGSVPAAKRRIIADHDDFDYMANAYGFKIVAHVRESGTQQSTASGIRKAIAAGETANAKAVITSWGQVDSGAGEVSLKLNIPKLALFSDALGPQGQAATSALRGVVFSINQAIQNLTRSSTGCTIPE